MDGWIDFTNTWCFLLKPPRPLRRGLEDGAREASGVTGGVQRRWVNRGKPPLRQRKEQSKPGKIVGYQDRKWGLDMRYH